LKKGREFLAHSVELWEKISDVPPDGFFRIQTVQNSISDPAGGANDTTSDPLVG